VECCYIDLISPAEQYSDYIKQKLPDLKMIIEAKADATYPITGAASIVAKVTRDNSLEGFGCSGYPGDQKTVDYLKSHCDKVYGFGNDVRMSWSTCEKLMESECVKVTWQVDREERSK
jgi:ribonuclease H2 subunit A